MASTVIGDEVKGLCQWPQKDSSHPFPRHQHLALPRSQGQCWECSLGSLAVPAFLRVPARPPNIYYHRCDAMEGVMPGSSTDSWHLQEQGPMAMRTYICDHCGRVCTSKAAVARHILSHAFTGEHGPTHAGVRNFECQECRKRFTVKSSLNTHILTHTGVKNFECQECGKRFTQKSNLKKHILTHTGVKSYECQECGKKFSRQCNLSTHILTHTGARNFECQECGKRFTLKSHLTSHILTHTGARNFECQECGKRFTHKCNLNTHSLTHSGERKFKCDVCGKCFLTKGRVAKHIQTHL